MITFGVVEIKEKKRVSEVIKDCGIKVNMGDGYYRLKGALKLKDKADLVAIDNKGIVYQYKYDGEATGMGSKLLVGLNINNGVLDSELNKDKIILVNIGSNTKVLGVGDTYLYRVESDKHTDGLKELLRGLDGYKEINGSCVVSVSFGKVEGKAGVGVTEDKIAVDDAESNKCDGRKVKVEKRSIEKQADSDGLVSVIKKVANKEKREKLLNSILSGGSELVKLYNELKVTGRVRDEDIIKFIDSLSDDK